MGVSPTSVMPCPLMKSCSTHRRARPAVGTPGCRRSSSPSCTRTPTRRSSASQSPAPARLSGTSARRTSSVPRFSRPEWVTATPFGLSGGTRGVDDVGDVGLPTGETSSPGAIVAALQCGDLPGDARSSSRAQVAAPVTGNSPTAVVLSPRIAAESSIMRDPIGRIVRVDRDVAGTGLGHRPDRRQALHRARDRQCHQVVGTDPVATEQPPRQPVGPLIEPR